MSCAFWDHGRRPFQQPSCKDKIGATGSSGVPQVWLVTDDPAVGFTGGGACGGRGASIYVG